MNLVLLLQIVFLVVIFILALLCVLLPLKIIPQDPTRITSVRSQRIIAFCNCLSGGVFLGTCYAQLIPYVDAKFREVFQQAGWDQEYTSTTTQCAVCLGFYLILTVEQLVKVCQGRSKKPGTSGFVDASERELLAIPPDLATAATVSDNSTGSDDSDTDSSQDSKRHMLRKSKPKPKLELNKQVKIENGGSTQINIHHHPHHHHHHHGHSHHGSAGHGHSHIADIVQNDFGLRCLLLLAALSMHSFFEGLAIGLQDTMASLVNLFVGVVVHECLMSFAMGVTLAQQKLKLSTMVKLSLAYSIMIPLGMGLGMAIGGIHTFSGSLASAIIQGITAGTFVYVIFLEILPAEINTESDKLVKIFFMFLGFALILCLRIGLDDH